MDAHAAHNGGRTAEFNRAGLVGGREDEGFSIYVVTVFSVMHLRAAGGSSMSEYCRKEGLQPIACFSNSHCIPSLVHAFHAVHCQACPLLSLSSSGPPHHGTLL